MGAVSKILTGGAPKPPAAPKPGPPPPTPVDPAVIEARRQQVAASRSRKGRASTILTSPMGIPMGAKTLLGE